MPHVLDTTKKIIDFVESQSIFIEHVYISEVHSGGFSFRIKVPIWYKYFFKWWLVYIIKKRMEPRMIVGVTFDYEFYT